MLPSSITLDYVDAEDDVTALSHTFEKRQLDPYKSEFREAGTVISPELEYHRLNVSAVEAKPTSSFYGVRRSNSSLRQDFVLDTPLGIEKPLPAVIKTTTSIPVKMTAIQQENLIRQYRAWINSDDFVDLVIKQST